MVRCGEKLEVPPAQTSDGTIKIKGTRINLGSIIYRLKKGGSPAEILEGFPYFQF